MSGGQIDRGMLSMFAGFVAYLAGLLIWSSGHRLMETGDLWVETILISALSIQVAALLLIRLSRLEWRFVAAYAFAIGACLGTLSPRIINTWNDPTERITEPWEVVSRHCPRSGRLELRPLRPGATARWFTVGVNACYQQSRGRVLRFRRGDGRLGAPWMTSLDRLNAVGPIVLDQQAWDASQQGRWEDCIDLATQALHYLPEGDVGRLLTNRGFCRSKMGDRLGARRD